MIAGAAFNDKDIWKNSIQYIHENGGFTPKFVQRAVDHGFDLFDSYRGCKMKLVLEKLDNQAFEFNE